jgi:Domain of unknown function (DUF4190)
LKALRRFPQNIRMDNPPPLPASAPQSRTTSGLAIASLVAGIISICGGLTSIVAIICGHLALAKVRRNPALAGRGLAIAGVTLGYSLLGIWVVLFAAGGLSALSEARAQPHGEVLSINGEPDTKLIDGNLDYGVTVSVVVRNKSKQAGTVTIKSWLSCSEGEWNRSQELVFNGEETKQLTYFFQEPTINATNIQYGANVFPK